MAPGGHEAAAPGSSSSSGGASWLSGLAAQLAPDMDELDHDLPAQRPKHGSAVGRTRTAGASGGTKVVNPLDDLALAQQRLDDVLSGARAIGGLLSGASSSKAAASTSSTTSAKMGKGDGVSSALSSTQQRSKEAPREQLPVFAIDHDDTLASEPASAPRGHPALPRRQQRLPNARVNTSGRATDVRAWDANWDTSAAVPRRDAGDVAAVLGADSSLMRDDDSTREVDAEEGIRRERMAQLESELLELQQKQAIAELEVWSADAPEPPPRVRRTPARKTEDFGGLAAPAPEAAAEAERVLEAHGVAVPPAPSLRKPWDVVAAWKAQAADADNPAARAEAALAKYTDAALDELEAGAAAVGAAVRHGPLQSVMVGVDRVAAMYSSLDRSRRLLVLVGVIFLLFAGVYTNDFLLELPTMGGSQPSDPALQGLGVTLAEERRIEAETEEASQEVLEASSNHTVSAHSGHAQAQAELDYAKESSGQDVAGTPAGSERTKQQQSAATSHAKAKTKTKTTATATATAKVKKATMTTTKKDDASA